MIDKFPADAPRAKVPSHRTIKGPTLRAICTQCRIPREDFLDAFGRAR